VKIAGKRILRHLSLIHIFPRGRNKQRFHIVTAKADHRRATNRKPVFFQLFTLGENLAMRQPSNSALQ
jgi:hypothetical protein